MTTVLWYGGGQDSTAILFMLAFDKAFREKYVKGELLVICSDTGNEFPETYNYIENVTKPFCKEQKIEFVHITPEMGFHPKTWHSLQAQFERNDGVMSVTFPKTCTDNLKIKPCYNYLEAYIKDKYGFEGTRKKAFYEYKEQFGKMQVMIGIGADEKSRLPCQNIAYDLFGKVEPKKKDYSPVFVKKCVEKIYPLAEIGYTRKKCQEAIASYGYEVPAPSNCMMCPYANELEMLYHRKAYPQSFAQWEAYEQAKIDKDSKRGKLRNNGVKGRRTLAEYIANADDKYPDVTIEELQNYRFSHGHCVKSRY